LRAGTEREEEFSLIVWGQQRLTWGHLGFMVSALDMEMTLNTRVNTALFIKLQEITISLQCKPGQMQIKPKICSIGTKVLQFPSIKISSISYKIRLRPGPKINRTLLLLAKLLNNLSLILIMAQLQMTS